MKWLLYILIIIVLYALTQGIFFLCHIHWDKTYGWCWLAGWVCCAIYSAIRIYGFHEKD